MRTQMKRIRGSANLIGLTLLAESAFSGVLCTPLLMLIGLLPLYGRTMAELCDLAAYLLVFAVPFLLMAKVDGMSLRTMAGEGRPPRSAYLTAVSAAVCAANGVDFLEPRKPISPADAQEIALPFRSLMVTMVLLKEERM